MTLNTTYNMTLSQCIDLHQRESTDSVYVTSFSYDDTDNSCISLWPVFLPPSYDCTNTSDVTLYTNLDRQETVANRSWAIILPGTVHRWHLDIAIFIIEFPILISTFSHIHMRSRMRKVEGEQTICCTHSQFKAFTFPIIQ